MTRSAFAISMLRLFCLRALFWAAFRLLEAEERAQGISLRMQRGGRP